MRIDQLKLLAYGPFSGEVLDFSAGEQGLHLVYGPNEAGKSTTLSAIEALLFGMSSAKLLDFLHPQADLRISARLRHGSETIDVIRRKGKAGSLRAANDKDTVEPALLNRFLGNLDGTAFRQRFGIDYDELVAGGEQVVAGKGEIGNLLFAAGTGLSNLKTIIAELEKTTGDLFKSSGSKPVINRLLSERDVAIKKRKSDELSSAVFESKTLAVEESTQKLRKLTADIVELEEKRRRIEAVRMAKTDIQQEQKIRESLSHHLLQKTPRLSEGFSERRIQLTTQKAKLDAAKQSLEDQKKRIQDELEVQVTSPHLTVQSSAIDRLRERLGSITKAMQDRPTLAATLVAQVKQCSEALRSLGLSEEGYTPLSKPDRALLEELLERYGKLKLRQDTQKETLVDLEKQLQQLSDKGEPSSQSGEFEKLQTAVRGASLLRGSAADLRTLRGQIEKETLELSTAVRHLRPWKGELADISQLSLPSDETLRLHETRLAKTGQELHESEEELRKVSAALDINRIEIRHLQVQGKVKSESDLAAARQERQELWQSFLSAKAVSSEAASQFERSLIQADEIADWLRLHSSEVAQLQSLQRDLQKLESQHALAAHRVQELKQESQAAHQSWQEVLSSLGQLLMDPTELREWRRAAIAIQQRLPSLAEKRAKLQLQGEELLACRAVLRGALGHTENNKEDVSHAEVGFAALLDEAEQRLAELHNAKKGQDKRQTLLAEKERQIATQRMQGETLQQEHAAWNSEWEAALARTPLGSVRKPVEVKAILAEHERILSLQADIADKQSRISGIDRDDLQFRQDVRALLTTLAADLLALEPAQALAELEQRRKQAVLAEDRVNQETKRLRDVEQKLEETERHLQETLAQLQKLCQEGRCAAIEELPQVEKRAADLRQLEEDRTQIRNRLSDLCHGASLEDFIVEANRHSLDEVNETLLGIQTELKLAQQERDRVQQQLAVMQDDLGRLGKSSSAAESEQESEQLLRQIQDQAEEYSRSKIAMFLLQKTIERYREKNQGPVLKRASELFSRLTLQSFAGLHPDVDESGNTVLKGARGDGKLIEVEQMSEGTCDQLYLSLRLSSLEYYLEQHQPLPLVIDDLLINFDDERCLAALKILLELSQKTQIIFFTHHEHLLALAKDHLASPNLFTHHMPERVMRA